MKIEMKIEKLISAMSRKWQIALFVFIGLFLLSAVTLTTKKENLPGEILMLLIFVPVIYLKLRAENLIKKDTGEK